MDCGHATTRRSGWTANRNKCQRHALALGRQTELLPRLHAAGEMAIEGQARALRDQGRGDGAITRTAGEDDLPALRIGDRGRVELRHRKIEGVGIALDLGLVRLPDIDQQDFALGQAARDLFRGQIGDVLTAKLSGHGAYSSFRRDAAASTPKQSRVMAPESREVSTDFT